ncbi:MAG: response regulator [Planctomycetota bacterium]
MIQRPWRVLVVESDPASFESLESVLNRLPENEYSVTWTRSSTEARRQLENAQVDVCLASSGDPADDPRRWAREAQRAGSRVPIILLDDTPGSSYLSENSEPSVRRSHGSDATRPNDTDWLEILPRRNLAAPQLESVLRSALRQQQAHPTQQAAQGRYSVGLRGPEGGLWEWDLSRDVVYYSDHWKRQLGFTSREIGDSIEEWFSRVHPEDIAGLRRRVESHLEGRSPHVEYEYRMRHKDGSYLWMMCHAEAAWSDDGEPLRIAGTNRDVSDRPRSGRSREARANQTHRMEALGRLAGAVEHDFNNLVTVMLGYTRILLEKVHEGSELRTDLLQIRKAGEQASLLTKQLLTFSRDGEEAPDGVDLAGSLEDLMPLVRVLVGENIEVELEAEKPPLLVRADPGQIEQVVLNLAANARDAMPRGGRLRLVARPVALDRSKAQRRCLDPGDYVRLEVIDNGSGMSEETAERLFEPFFTTKDGGEGNGLGLATVYSIIERCGGHIDVESALGEGTRFELHFPWVSLSAAEALAEPGHVEQPAPPEEHAASSERILLVEDNDNVRGLVERILESFDYQVLAAENADRAVELCDKHGDEIDLLLTDVIMPKVDGRELAEKLRARFPSLKVLFMSGYPGDRLKGHGIWTEATHFIPKPFEAEDLAAKVREILDAAAAKS